MSKLDIIRQAIEKKLAEKQHRPTGAIYIGRDLYLKQDVNCVVLFDINESRDTVSVGSVAADGEWRIWPTHYEVIAEELGVSLGTVEGEAA